MDGCPSEAWMMGRTQPLQDPSCHLDLGSSVAMKESDENTLAPKITRYHGDNYSTNAHAGGTSGLSTLVHSREAPAV